MKTNLIFDYYQLQISIHFKNFDISLLYSEVSHRFEPFRAKCTFWPNFFLSLHTPYFTKTTHTFLFWRTWKKKKKKGRQMQILFSLRLHELRQHFVRFICFSACNGSASFSSWSSKIDRWLPFQYVHVTCVRLKYAYDNIFYILFFIYVIVAL